MSMFKKAVKAESKLRLAIAGPSGSGKTYTSLAIAAALANGAPIAVVDTEHGSAAKYADIFTFDVAEMHAPFHPDKYIQAIQDAAAAGYAVIVLDSMTHAWAGTGGVLDMVDEAAKRSKSGNTYMAWKEGTPVQNKLIEAIVTAPLHVIATVRSKTEYAMQTNSNGKQEPKKIGMAPEQRNGFEYEFDVFLDMDTENNGIVSKTRCPALTGRVFSKPRRDVANILSEWLRGAPATQPQQEATPASTPPAAQNGTATGNSPANGGGAGNGSAMSPAMKAFHKAGTSLYGDNWDAKRHEIVKAATKGRTASSKDLTASELAFLLEGLSKRLEERLDAAVEDAPEFNPDALTVPA